MRNKVKLSAFKEFVEEDMTEGMHKAGTIANSGHQSSAFDISNIVHITV